MLRTSRWTIARFLRSKGFSTPRAFSSSNLVEEYGLLPLFPPATCEALRRGLEEDGFCILNNFASKDVAQAMRNEAQRLFDEGYMFQSMSVDEHGRSFPKDNVFASELDGNEWDVAPTILHYTRSVMLQAPEMLNSMFPELQISSRAYATKLAVSLGDGASYPKHCDTAGLPDQRKVTMVYYLNPNWEPSHGGQLQVYAKDGVHVVEPRSDTLAVFWSDQVVHDVKPCENSPSDVAAQRFALTLWLVTDDPKQIIDPNHPLYDLRCQHFQS
ncbi:hypothetical protein LEN26_008426 [Aphanomyces euteiches]|nr:hypothetical protein AeMF1_002686 [Aphanomyces euteiches]KAH9130543.1 hypothetical protein LEN26_008426 [Aphanomyces euteiches]KAH9141316.1 hypothetical protein AeRB84_014517 [Aphanomyces euteiches]KAH9142350.1 hypothetical protein AeRB84_013619 [Aphanomyces euteiches]KAH9146485.1 hypothetical protein AeRB84_009590 [Aphanomyces euteiches]